MWKEKGLAGEGLVGGATNKQASRPHPQHPLLPRFPFRAFLTLHLGHGLVLATIHDAVAPSMASELDHLASSSQEAGLCGSFWHAKQNLCPAPHVTTSSDPCPCTALTA